jgi:hypothetical protein
MPGISALHGGAMKVEDIDIDVVGSTACPMPQPIITPASMLMV